MYKNITILFFLFISGICLADPPVDYFETGLKRQINAGININQYSKGNYRGNTYGFYTINFLLQKVPGTYNRFGATFNQYTFSNNQSNTTSFSFIGKLGREYSLYNKNKKIKISAGIDLCLAYFNNRIRFAGFEHTNSYVWWGPGINPFFSATWYAIKNFGINTELSLPLYYLVNNNQANSINQGILWVDRVVSLQLAYRF